MSQEDDFNKQMLQAGQTFEAMGMLAIAEATLDYWLSARDLCYQMGNSRGGDICQRIIDVVLNQTRGNIRTIYGYFDSKGDFKDTFQ